MSAADGMMMIVISVLLLYQVPNWAKGKEMEKEEEKGRKWEDK